MPCHAMQKYMTIQPLSPITGGEMHKQEEAVKKSFRSGLDVAGAHEMSGTADKQRRGGKAK